MTENSWLLGLRASGVLVSGAVLDEELPSGPPVIKPEVAEALRQAWNRFEAGTSSVDDWLKALVHGPLGVANHPLFELGENSRKRLEVPAGIADPLLPDGAWLAAYDSRVEPRVLVWKVDSSRKPRAAWDRATTGALRLLRDLRPKGLQLGLVTDGRAFRLIFVGIENEAWLQWDATQWFSEESRPDELNAFAWILHYDRLGLHHQSCPLVELATRSRRKQADIADEVGIRVRQAVEMLLSEAINTAAERATLLNQVHPIENISKGPSGAPIVRDDAIRAVYQAAIRVVMRIVVASYAEARDLFPMENSFYAENYSISILHKTLRGLREVSGPAFLKGRQWAWPRILSLFSLIHRGGRHPDLQMTAYGGRLFQAGDAAASDAVARALALLEDPRALSDHAVLEILDRVRRSTFKLNLGGLTKTVEGPVDFRDLRTEFIGIMYEGLLDYSPILVAADDGAYVRIRGKGFHAYPLSRLEALQREGNLKDFLRAVREGSSSTSEDEDSDEEAPDEATEEMEGDSEEGSAPPSPESLETGASTLPLTDDVGRRIAEWGHAAVLAAGAVYEGSNSGDVEDAVRSLVVEVHPPGTFFLMNWRGYRKGSGTYYTRPTLVVPLVQRTLDPLLYKDRARSVPTTPDEIVKLRICDPAMGSGSFLVASAQRITSALYEAWLYYGLVNRLRSGERLLLPTGDPSTGIEEELIVGRHPDDEGFFDYLLARLRRHVVERCIYGVDINPLAVELARISLWIETMDRTLPFEFLDHKLREGNSLVGTWLNEALDYPIAAWDRANSFPKAADDGKDPLKSASTPIRAALQETRKSAKGEFIRTLRGIAIAPLNGARITEMSGIVRNTYERIHNLPEKRREEAYQRLVESEELGLLRRALNRWCAIWFWPAADPSSPERAPGPEWFYNEWPPQPQSSREKMVEALAEELSFFHWELEFPDVFLSEKGGFDAVVGNPPWDKVKPESVPFFARHDPLFPTYRKQRALQVLRELFQRNPTLRTEWARYTAQSRSQSHFYQGTAQAFATSFVGREAKARSVDWYRRIESHGNGPFQRWYTDGTEVAYPPTRPFTLWRGGRELNLYKLFAEQSLRLARPTHGRSGLVLPGAIYGDLGAVNLRKTFLEHCRWEWLYAMENKRRIFPAIHASYVVACSVVERGGNTDSLRSAFMVQDVKSWEKADGPEILLQSADLIRHFSPRSLTPVQPPDDRGLQLMEQIRSNSLLTADLETLQFANELHTTGDSRLLVRREKLREGTIDAWGRFLSRDGRLLLPAIVGAQIRLYDPLRGIGDTDKPPIHWFSRRANGDYYISQEDYVASPKRRPLPRVVYRHVARNTDTRTFIPTFLPQLPTLHSLYVIRTSSLEEALCTLTWMSSLPFDYYVRHKTSSVDLSEYVLKELPQPKSRVIPWNATLLGLVLPLIDFAPESYLTARGMTGSWTDLLVWREDRRLESRVKLDVFFARQLGLAVDHVARLCDISGEDVRGFHRGERQVAPKWRYPMLVQVAFSKLDRDFSGSIGSFLDEWRLPQEAIEARDRAYGPTWVGWDPGERLPPAVDPEERLALHIHRDVLREMISSGQKLVPRAVLQPYEELWERVWKGNENRSRLSWEDCLEYTRCYLHYLQPQGAFERFEQVIEGKMAYQQIYDPSWSAPSPQCAKLVDDGQSVVDAHPRARQARGRNQTSLGQFA